MDTVMTGKEIHSQIQFASQVVANWPAWKQNILSHSSQPTNSHARSPVDNQVGRSPSGSRPIAPDATWQCECGVRCSTWYDRCCYCGTYRHDKKPNRGTPAGRSKPRPRGSAKRLNWLKRVG